jgi:hypothetical protein
MQRAERRIGLRDLPHFAVSDLQIQVEGTGQLPAGVEADGGLDLQARPVSRYHNRRYETCAAGVGRRFTDRRL